MKKSTQLERLDTGDYTAKEYQHCLKQLGQIGKWLGGDKAGLKAFEGLSPNSILDVGCGGGHFTALLAKRYPKAQVVGIDLNEQAIALAEQQVLPNLHFESQKGKSLSGRDPVDVVTATLVCHHMGDNELILFLKEAKTLAKEAVIINDLQRSRLAYLLFSFISPLFRNRLITEDGLLSIRRSFTRREWRAHLAAAGFTHYKIQWRRGFRLMIIAFCQ